MNATGTAPGSENLQKGQLFHNGRNGRANFSTTVTKVRRRPTFLRGAPPRSKDGLWTVSDPKVRS